MIRKQINLNNEAAYDALTTLAARLGYLTVGSAAHGEGSPRQLLLALTRAYRAAPADEVELFERLLVGFLEHGSSEPKH